MKVKSHIEYGEEQDDNQYDYGDELPDRAFADGGKEPHKKSSKAEERKQPAIEFTNMDHQNESIGFAGKRDAEYDTKLQKVNSKGALSNS